MNDAALADPVIARLKGELDALYGARLKRVVFYGSRARGDHGPESDYDLIVMLEDPIDQKLEQKKLSELGERIGWETIAEGHPVVAYFKLMTEEQMQQRTGFMHNVRLEGIDL